MAETVTTVFYSSREETTEDEIAKRARFLVDGEGKKLDAIDTRSQFKVEITVTMIDDGEAHLLDPH